MKTVPPFDYRGYQPGDELQIIPLYEASFGRTMGRTESQEHWKWEFLGNPLQSIWIRLAHSSGVLASHYACTPLDIQIQGRTQRAGLSLDTMTAEQFRGMGLFRRLSTDLYRQMAEEGAVLVCGFPNQNSAPAFFGKMGWVEIAPFPLLVRPLPGALARYASRYGILGTVAGSLGDLTLGFLRPRAAAFARGITLEEVSRFPEAMDEFWNRARAGKTISVERTSRYLNWRYADIPEHLYRSWLLKDCGRIIGYVVTLSEERFGIQTLFLMDFVGDPGTLAPAEGLPAAVIEIANRTGALLISALCYPGTPEYSSLRKLGFVHPPSRLFPKEIHFGFKPLRTALDSPAISRPSDWFISWGDTDIL